MTDPIFAHKYLMLPATSTDERHQREVDRQIEALTAEVDRVTGDFAKIDAQPLHAAVKGDRKARIRVDAVDAIERTTAGALKRLKRQLEYANESLGAGHRLFREDNPDGHSTPRVKERDRINDAVTSREVRDRFLALPAGERLPVALQAATDNDLLTLRAIKSAPTSFPVLTKDEWQEVDELHLRKHFPDELQGVVNIRATISQLEGNIFQARTAIGLQPETPEAQVVS